MIGALLYLRLTSLRNLIVFRVKRLKNPKYLFGAVVAGLYLYFVLYRRTAMVTTGPAGAVAGKFLAAGACVALAAVALVRVLYAWIFPPEKPGLRFSEAEIAFLFPAPMTRRTLINFRLMSAQIGILFTSFLIVYFFRRAGGSGSDRILGAIGWWVILSTLDLHLNGTNLLLARMKERGAGYLLFRLLAVVLIVGYVVALVWSAANYINGLAGNLFDNTSADGLVSWVPGLMASSPFHWLVLPLRIVTGPYFANGLRDFVVAFVPALAVLALHYYWVAGTEVRFEEGSIAQAEKRASVKEAMLRGEGIRVGLKQKPLQGPFTLRPTGLPEVAFLWKNLLCMRSSLLNRRSIMLSIWILICLSMAMRGILAGGSRAHQGNFYSAMTVAVCGVITAYTLLVGPQMARQDLRTDLPNLDILKTYPIEGWRLALGELLAPTAILTSILWVCIVVCAFAIDPTSSLEWLTPTTRFVAALCLGIVAPFLCILQLMVPNTMMVLMPSWYQATRSRGGGIELMGQRLIFGVGQLLIAAFVAAPATLAAILIIFSSQWVVGAAAAMLLALMAVLTILGSELAIALWWLGERFTRIDLSTELR